MAERSSFGQMVARLLDHRCVNVASIAAEYGIPVSELQSVLDGAAPRQETLGRLATAFGWHTEDMFVAASVSLPDDMTPLDPEAGLRAGRLVEEAMKLSVAGRAELRQFARSLPQQPRAPRTGDAPATPEWKRYPPGFGAVLVHLLENRNLDWGRAVHTLLFVTHGRLGLSRVTIGSIGHGRKVLTPSELADFAVLLGIHLGDLAALANVELPAGLELPEPVPEIPQLIWDARRLTAAQVEQVIDMTKVIKA